MEAAQNLKITAQNLKSMVFTSIKKLSDARKDNKRLRIALRNRDMKLKKEKKIEMPKFLERSVSKIGGKIGQPMGNLFNNALGLVSLLLVGTVMNNVDEIKDKIDEKKDKFKEDNKLPIAIVNFIFKRTKQFLNLFKDVDKEQALKDAENYEKASKEANSQLEKTYEEALSLEKIMKLFGSNTENTNFIKEEGELSTGDTFRFVPNDKNDPTLGGNFFVTTGGETKKMDAKEFFQLYPNEVENVLSNDYLNFLDKDEKMIFDSKFLELLNKNNDSKDLSMLSDFTYGNGNRATRYVLQRVIVDSNSEVV